MASARRNGSDAMTRRLNRALIALALVAVVPSWWLLAENGGSDAAPMPVPLAELRTLADSQPGPRASAIAVEVLAERQAPGTMVAAGIGFALRRIALPAFAAAFPDGRRVIIGGADPDRARSMGFEQFDTPAARRLAKARAAAGATILPTPAEAKSPRAVAPGVVVIPATGMRPGTQMVYLRLQGGGEVLFALGVSPLEANWRDRRGPPRWSTLSRPHDDRAATYRWLATIQAWKRQAPNLLVIPGEDSAWLADHARRPPFSGRFPG